VEHTILQVVVEVLSCHQVRQEELEVLAAVVTEEMVTLSELQVQKIQDLAEVEHNHSHLPCPVLQEVVLVLFSSLTQPDKYLKT
tara:strand:- start:12 stop:263 length:252 start_codon:yes stop_codon:yes gene_type:complete